MNERTNIEFNIIEYNSKEISRNEIVWSKNLRNFLEDLLKKIISVNMEDIHITEAQFADYFNEDCMTLWKKAFTHDSFSETFNFEMLEFLGDKILKCIFIRWFIYRDPDLERSKMTFLEISIMNGIEQSRIGKLLGLEPHIRCISNTLVMQPIVADVFESFTGALFQNTKNYQKNLLKEILVKLNGIGFHNIKYYQKNLLKNIMIKLIGI